VISIIVISTLLVTHQQFIPVMLLNVIGVEKKKKLKTNVIKQILVYALN